MKQYTKFFLYCGILLVLSEIWKQWTLTFLLNNGRYDWWYFPFQLCSIPMYVCVALPFVSRLKIQRCLLAFLMDFGLLGGIFAFFDTSGMHYGYLPLTVHSFTWHVLLIIIGIRAGIIWRTLTGADAEGAHSTIYTPTLPYSATAPVQKPSRGSALFPQDYLGAAGIYLTCCLAALCLNLACRRHGAINMFYISPYYPMQQKVFDQIAASLGNETGIIIYLLATLAGARVSHQFWKTRTR